MPIRRGIELAWRGKSQHHLAVIADVDGELLAFRRATLFCGEFGPYATQCVEKMLARPQGVRAKIGTRAVRLTSLFTAERQSIRFSRRSTGDDVVRPSSCWIGGLQPVSFLLRPRSAFLNGPFDELVFTEVFQWDVHDRRIGQPQHVLVIENQ
jgi:hypothetical protein